MTGEKRVWYSSAVPTKSRIAKVEHILNFKQPDLHVVLEEVVNTHNASAAVRTCDAAGILYVDIIYSEPEPFPVNEAISTRAEKWLHFSHFTSTAECLAALKKKGLKIAATHLGKAAQPYTALDYTQPLALVFGNESEGISDEALEMADHIIKIPMFGMAHSLNLSVSVGIILYEAMKQRREKGFYDQRRLSPEEFALFRKLWLGL